MVSPKEVYEEAKKREDENLLFRNFLKALFCPSRL